jgi:hypothetical protein
VFCALSQRHYDVKASKHLASLLTTNWQRERKQVAQPTFSGFCAISQQQIIGPMFFDTTLTSQVYIEHTGGHFQHLLWQLDFIQVWHANVNLIFRGYLRVGRTVHEYQHFRITISTFILIPWRWKQYISSKHWHVSSDIMVTVLCEISSYTRGSQKGSRNGGTEM